MIKVMLVYVYPFCSIINGVTRNFVWEGPKVKKSYGGSLVT